MSNLLLSGHTGEVLTVRFNRQSNLLASGGMDKNILIWDCKDSFTNTQTLSAHTNAVTSLTWSDTFLNPRLISASADRTLCNWDIDTGKLIRKHKKHDGVVQDVSCTKKNKDLIASVGDDGNMKIWEHRAKNQVMQYKGKYPYTAVCFGWEADFVYFGGIDNQIWKYCLRTGQIVQKISGHLDTISSLQISHDGAYLMSNSFDQTLRIWSTKNSEQDKRLVKTMSGHSQGSEKTLIRGTWSRDGLYVASGSIDKCVYIWDASTRKIVQRLGGHNGTVTQVCMGDNNIMASASHDKNIIISELPDIFL